MGCCHLGDLLCQVTSVWVTNAPVWVLTQEQKGLSLEFEQVSWGCFKSVTESDDLKQQKVMVSGI